MNDQLSMHSRLKRAYSERFGPEPEPPGQTSRDRMWDRLASLANFLLAITGWLWIIGAPITWGWNKIFHQ